MSDSPTIPPDGNRFIPSGPPTRRISLWTIVIIALVGVVVLGVFIIGIFVLHPTSNGEKPVQSNAHLPVATHRAPSSKPPANAGASGNMPGINPPTKQQSTALVGQYYAAINARNYQGAYNLWGNAFRSSTSYDIFVQGFADTQKDTVQYGAPSSLTDGTVKVPVTITATIATGTSSYQGYYILGVERGTTRILNANIELTASTDDSVNKAVATVNQYFADINAKNYQGAYDLWGKAYHNSTSYEQFASGFANTQSVTTAIPFGDVAVLKDGSVQVPITINSVDKTGNGTVNHTFLGYYIVGIEGTTWQLLKANVQQVN